MSREPLTVSDWIQFLTNTKNGRTSVIIYSYTIGFFLFAFSLSILSLKFDFSDYIIKLYTEFNVDLTGQLSNPMLDILVYIVVFSGLIFITKASVIIIYPQSEYNRARKLLNKIMYQGYNDPDIISREWCIKSRLRISLDTLIGYILILVTLFLGIGFLYELVNAKVFETFLFLNMIIVILLLYKLKDC